MVAESENDSAQRDYFDKLPASLVEEAVDTALLAGHRIFPEKKLLELIDLTPKSAEESQAAAIEFNKAAVSNAVREQLVRRMRKSLTRSLKLKHVAETFAWGVPIARELTGKLFKIEMIGGDDYGYTRLNENKIYINPLAIFQRKPHGREVVEGLILHELGHHIYHRGKGHQKIWDKAKNAGLHRLLNLVSDEHLERNLRAVDRRFGDKLKRLGAYVFQHTSKEFHYRSLLQVLHIHAFSVLSAKRMKIARRPECIKLMTRDLLQQMDKSDVSFSRFFRALRLGLGNRYDDPKVEEALKLFGKSFRKSSMSQLYQITLKLKEIFGSECDILECVGQSQIVEGEGSQTMIDGEGITDKEIEAEIRRISNPDEGAAGGSSGSGRWINVSDNLKFEPITNIQRVSASQTEHQTYVQPVSYTHLRAPRDRG